MARNPNLVAAQAQAMINQLLEEPLYGSPTADELVENLVDGDGSYASILFNPTAADIIMALPVDERERVGRQFVRIAEQHELGISRKRADWEALKGQAALLQAAEYKERAREAEKQLAGTAVAIQVADRLRELAGGALRSAPAPPEQPVEEAAPIPVTKPYPDVPRGKAKKRPLWSAVEREFLLEKTRVVPGHREYDYQTVRQTEATMHLWTAIVGDRPIDDYDGSDAGTFRDIMLRMPSSHGKGGTRDQTRKLTPPLEAIRLADEKQKGIDSRNAVLSCCRSGGHAA